MVATASIGSLGACRPSTSRRNATDAGGGRGMFEPVSAVSPLSGPPRRCSCDSPGPCVSSERRAPDFQCLGCGRGHCADVRFTSATSSTRQVAPRSRLMLRQGARKRSPSRRLVSRSQSMAADDPTSRASMAMCRRMGQRLNVLPLFPMDIADEAILVHIALGANDRELADAACALAQHQAELNRAWPRARRQRAHF